AQQLDQISKAFRPEMAAVGTNIPMNRSMSFALGNQVNLLGRPFGFSGSLSYNNSYSAVANGSSGRYALIGNLDDTSILTPLFSLDDVSGTANTDIGGLVTASYKLSD